MRRRALENLDGEARAAEEDRGGGPDGGRRVRAPPRGYRRSCSRSSCCLSRDHQASKDLCDSLVEAYDEAQMAETVEVDRQGNSFRISAIPVIPADGPSAPNRTRPSHPRRPARSQPPRAPTVLVAEQVDSFVPRRRRCSHRSRAMPQSSPRFLVSARADGPSASGRWGRLPPWPPSHDRRVVGAPGDAATSNWSDFSPVRAGDHHVHRASILSGQPQGSLVVRGGTIPGPADDGGTTQAPSATCEWSRSTSSGAGDGKTLTSINLAERPRPTARRPASS